MKNWRQTSVRMTRHPLTVAVAAACLAAGQAAAFDINTGNDDVAMRWDNTVRYNAGWRAHSRNNKIGNTATYDEGDYKFNNGDMVANRLDILSELDFVYKKDYGYRVSAAGWYDRAYGSTSKANPNLSTATNSYPNQQFSPYVKRFYHGPSGEILDAFVFGKVDAGDVPIKLKAGRHTVFWGESLLLNGAFNSVSYAQNPLDLQKGFATPGVEAKELFRPLSQISGQAQLTNTLSVAAQYFLQWEAFRYPEGGTYLGPADVGFNGPIRAQTGVNLGDPSQPKNSGEFGLSARWSPEVLDGTVGVYYRRYSDKLPQVFLTAANQYRLVYADKIDMWGVSLAKNIGGVSVGSELSYRHNTPLASKLLGNVISLSPFAGGDTPGPRGDTMHGLVNVMGTVGKTPVFDAASWAGELTWAHWNKVTRDPKNLFSGLGYGGCPVNGSRWDGCVTKNYVGLGATFTPTWYQVMSGVDLSAPLTYSIGVKGNAPTTFAGSQGNGTYTVGLGADVQQKYRFDLKYVSYFGHMKDNGTSITAANGLSTVLQDRDFVSLTFKTTF